MALEMEAHFLDRWGGLALTKSGQTGFLAHFRSGDRWRLVGCICLRSWLWNAYSGGTKRPQLPGLARSGQFVTGSLLNILKLARGLNFRVPRLVENNSLISS